jgi:heme exporter protein D
MIWNSAADFFAMGGYGLYVWGSYAVVALWMAVEPIAATRRHQAAIRRIRETREQDI